MQRACRESRPGLSASLAALSAPVLGDPPDRRVGDWHKVTLARLESKK
jgi:hypothetical protein